MKTLIKKYIVFFILSMTLIGCGGEVVVYDPPIRIEGVYLDTHYMEDDDTDYLIRCVSDTLSRNGYEPIHGISYKLNRIVSDAVRGYHPRDSYDFIDSVKDFTDINSYFFRDIQRMFQEEGIGRTERISYQVFILDDFFSCDYRLNSNIISMSGTICGTTPVYDFPFEDKKGVAVLCVN